MSYQVLARKWRPRTFEEMVGQEHVLRALVNALDRDRLHHAFLFTGTRGVGKTTIARILAKSLNCEQGVGSKPCGQCSACQEIDQGRFVDLIEVDAASRTKVEDTRELLDNVQYAPARGRYKVYLVDEVHMLSDHSFNALLKTLEEPPPHVKFLLATTDPQKLPVTILSRCLQFNLKRLPIDRIGAHLAQILEAEGIGFEPPALQAVARAADGSMRDALSLLDQAIAHGGGRVETVEVCAMLGTIDRAHVHALLERLADGDGQGLLERVEQLAQQAPDFAGVLGDLLGLLHRVALAQTVPGAVDRSAEDGDAVLALAARLAPEDVQLFYQIGLVGRRDLPLAPDPRSGLEMTLLRMLAFRPLSPAADSRTSAAGQPAAAAPSAGARRPGSSDAAPSVGAAAAVGAAEPGAGASWEAIVEQLGLRGAARELAAHCVWQGRDGDRVGLGLDPTYEQLASEGARVRLEQALGRYLGQAIRLQVQVGTGELDTPARSRSRRQEIRQQEAVNSIKGDRVVQDLQDVFDAEVRPDLIQPVD